MEPDSRVVTLTIPNSLLVRVVGYLHDAAADKSRAALECRVPILSAQMYASASDIAADRQSLISIAAGCAQ